MKLSKLASLIAVAGLAACTVVVIADVTVELTVDGKADSSKCTEYGIDSWTIVLDGPERPMPTFDVKCGDRWSISDQIEEGRYDIQVSAADASGTLLATKSKNGVFIDGVAATNVFSFDFTASDFSTTGPTCGDGTCDAGETPESCSEDCEATETCGDGTCDAGETPTSCPKDCEAPKDASLLISWKINGTLDGSSTGKSWDTCDEVGAAKVRITIGEDAPVVVPCADNEMSTQIMGLAPGSYTIKIGLLDASENPITTEAGDEVTASQDPKEEPFEFFYDSFNSTIKETTTGDYLFRTVFEATKLKCGETSPQVGFKLHLLQLDGGPVAAQVCYPGDSNCVDTGASNSAICQDFDQTIKDLNWGAYKLKVEAGPPGSTQICWSTDNKKDTTGMVDILVGAGKVNPVVEQILERIDTTLDCM